jgi:hypothetical protein
VPDLSLKERCVRRLEGLKQSRRGFEGDAKEIASYTGPARSRFLSSDTNRGRQSNRRLNNGHGIRAFRILQGGMTSGLSSQSRPWMNLGSQSEDVADRPEVKAYWGEVERLMYLFLGRTNYYGAVKTGYLEMGQFGTEACVMVEHLTEGAVCHQLTFGEYWLGLGSALTPDALYRLFVKTVKQAVDEFGTANLNPRIVSMYDRSSYDELITFYHAIETNDDQEPNRLDFRGKPWRSVYWDEADGDKNRLIQKQGFAEQPFWAPRWDTTGADVWGQGPGHDALPDLRELQLQTKRKAEATDMLVWPEVVTTSKTKLRRQPKSVVNMAEVDLTNGNPVHVVNPIPYQAIPEIRADVDSCKQAINEATYADLFMAITNMNGIQPRNIEEIAARNEEKLTQLGPVIERVNNEKLEIAIERVFGIMQRAGMFPPAPEILREAPDLKIQFISILTQMQRMVGLGPIERTVGFVGGLAATFPEVRHKIDAMELVDEYAERAGCPSKIIRSTEDAEEDAAAEAQAAQAAQAAEIAAKAAPAGKVAVDAASLMAESGAGALPIAGAMPL